MEVALDRIPTFCFDRSVDGDELLFYDLQTPLEGAWPGRLGSGRAGIYRGKYLKGVGRTPAAANWRNADDRYHGSGHLSVASALRERLISIFLTARGAADAIVPCESVLLRALKPGERRAVRSGRTSSVATFAPADGRMAALTVKPADFARPANFIFALDHFGSAPRDIGTLFLDLERYLRPPGERKNVEGAPADIVRALDAAFRRGRANFEAFARAGLHWVYVGGNFTLDGRFHDLETPHYFGVPFVGMRVREKRADRFLVGFEEFGFVRYWRRFLDWLRARLRLLRAPGLLAEPESLLFLAELQRELDRRFSRPHDLYSDRAVVMRAVDNLATALDLGARGRARLRELAVYAFRVALYSAADPLPDLGWRRLAFRPAPATPMPFRYEAPAFLDARLTPDAEEFAARLERLDAEEDPASLLLALARIKVAATA